LDSTRAIVTDGSPPQEPLVSIIGIFFDKTVGTQRRRKRASNLRNFESHLKCSLTASAYLISRRKIS
jgi:hypothetical protein